MTDIDLHQIKAPTKQLDSEFISNLVLESSKCFPLPGATIIKNNYSDPRIKVSSMLGMSDKISLYDHIATVRHVKSDRFFVAFKQTMDCLFLEQQDKDKFPEWLMKSQNKQTELSIHIYEVKMINGRHVFPSDLKMTNSLNSFEDWLKPIDNAIVFESVAHFLLTCQAITIDMMRKL